VGGLTAGGTGGSETLCEGQQRVQTRLWRLEASENSRVDSMGTKAKIHDIFLVPPGGGREKSEDWGRSRKEGLEAVWKGKVKAREAGLSGGMAPGMWTWSRPIAAGGFAEPTKATGNIFLVYVVQIPNLLFSLEVNIGPRCKWPSSASQH
jgi:hypothetical protein